ncbi:MAG: hypothetical protein H7A36_00635 [Chlamydiales bacterium]|nr:hypothetical protein [Chlamydiales bacterium]
MRTFWIVTFIHVFIVALFLLKRLPESPPPQKLHIETITLKPQAIAPQPKPIASSPQPVQTVAPQPIAVAPPKPKAEAAKPKTSDTKPQPTKKIGKQAGDLRKLIQQSLDQLDSTPTTATTSTKPQKVGELQCENLATYESVLIEYLKQLLELPEEGEVKVQLTLDRHGKVVKHRITSATNIHNQTYVDREIAQLCLPPFENYFKGESTHTFPITLHAAP